jgi:hypothetical protein
VVNAVDESLALEKAKSILANQSTLAATPLGATLRELRAPIALVVTPRSIVSAREYASSSPIKRAKYAAALQAPTAFTPIVLSVAPNQSGPANRDMRLVTKLPRDAMNAFVEFSAADAAPKLITTKPLPTTRPVSRPVKP